jgi:hypothetical protein
MLFNGFGAFGTQDLFAPDRRLFGRLAVSDHTPNRSRAQSSDVKHPMIRKYAEADLAVPKAAMPRRRIRAACITPAKLQKPAVERRRNLAVHGLETLIPSDATVFQASS